MKSLNKGRQQPACDIVCRNEILQPGAVQRFELVVCRMHCGYTELLGRVERGGKQATEKKNVARTARRCESRDVEEGI
jgi:hypothetical protein